MRKIILGTVALVLATALPANTPGAGIPVIDVSNLAQNIITALHQVLAYAQQIEQYQTQIRQYLNQVENTTGIAQALQIWQRAQQTMNGLMQTVAIFQNGNVQGIVGQFQNVNYWLQVPPSNYTLQPGGNVLQKQANDAMIQGLAKQAQQIQSDAANLQRLQTSAGSADGAMQALTAGNQLAALQQAQLLQIRSLLLQEQQALAARNSTLQNNEAMHQAATIQYYGTQLGPENNQGW
jgi:P-type conjugative transfer protein TrbJ